MLTNIIIVSMITWGVSALFDSGMLLSRLGDILVPYRQEETWWQTNWHKPLFSCPVCMASVYGTLASIHLHYNVSQWLVTCFAVCGLNYLMMSQLNK